jgi:hypothetical protein
MNFEEDMGAKLPYGLLSPLQHMLLCTLDVNFNQLDRFAMVLDVSVEGGGIHPNTLPFTLTLSCKTVPDPCRLRTLPVRNLSFGVGNGCVVDPDVLKSVQHYVRIESAQVVRIHFEGMHRCI